jgi:hypothetical protein
MLREEAWYASNEEPVALGLSSELASTQLDKWKSALPGASASAALTARIRGSIAAFCRRSANDSGTGSKA